MTDNHDVGFIMNCSFGNARRLLKTDKYDALLAETAASIMTSGLLELAAFVGG